MAENTQDNERYRTADEKESIKAQTTADGRYIPYTGGIMTWYENSGLLKSELPQGYRFHEMVDAESVRMKLFERWGGGENISRRASERMELSKPIHLHLVSSAGTAVACKAKDYSSHGLRLQLEDTDESAFSKGEKIRVVIVESGESGSILFDITSQVMWAHQVGKTSETLSMGIAFMELSTDKRQSLLQFFRR